jgi:hypothetical protein
VRARNGLVPRHAGAPGDGDAPGYPFLLCLVTHSIWQTAAVSVCPAGVRRHDAIKCRLHIVIMLPMLSEMKMQFAITKLWPCNEAVKCRLYIENKGAYVVGDSNAVC